MNLVRLYKNGYSYALEEVKAPFHKVSEYLSTTNINSTVIVDHLLDKHFCDSIPDHLQVKELSYLLSHPKLLIGYLLMNGFNLVFDCPEASYHLHNDCIPVVYYLKSNDTSRELGKFFCYEGLDVDDAFVAFFRSYYPFEAESVLNQIITGAEIVAVTTKEESLLKITPNGLATGRTSTMKLFGIEVHSPQ